jgi:cytidylate kinase
MTDDLNSPVITIDGPVSSGKGTVSRRLAGLLGWHILDSGMLYRLVAHESLKKGINGTSAEHEQELVHLANELTMLIMRASDGEDLLSDPELSATLRTPQVSEQASRIAQWPSLRRALLAAQHRWRRPPGLVADGRDMGTVVFPDAQLKFFLTASPDERARRRFEELRQGGWCGTLESVYSWVLERDTRDMSREVAPLVPAPDAIVIDSTHLSAQDVVERLKNMVLERGLTTPRTEKGGFHGG